MNNPKLGRNHQPDYLTLFLRSRQVEEVSASTLLYYHRKLSRFMREVDSTTAIQTDIEQFLIQFTNPGNRYSYYRALNVFFKWRNESYHLPNPMGNMKGPRLPKLILPSLSQEQVQLLIESANNARDRAIVALFTESGLRLSELTPIKVTDIDWNDRIVRVIGKGRKEAHAPFGECSEKHLRDWLNQYQPTSNIWGLTTWGVTAVLRRLHVKTGLPCNPHVFRRTFACLLRKSGMDTMTIKDLGRWESIDMVQRYTRTVTFRDSLKHYRGPLSE